VRLLVDTHVWLWLQTSPERIGSSRLEQLADPETEVLVSSVTAWEIAIKFALGKLALPDEPATYVPDRMRSTGSVELPVQHRHALAVATLPLHHRDPFDRLLIAQALDERIPLLTADPAFAPYDL
jgi:PIN domain nuclease of toxin-antitoxin system